MYGIEVWQLWPQAGPFWRRDPETGEREIFESYEAAARRSNELMYREDLTGFCFRAVEYREDQG